MNPAKTICRRLLLLLMLLPGASALAAKPGGLFVIVSFEVFAPPNCTVTVLQGGSINFAEVKVDDVNGRDNAKKIPYRVSCLNPSKVSALKLKFSGISGFNTEVLRTNMSNLGLRFRVDGTAQPLNKEFQVNYFAQPNLMAVLDKKPGATLQAGAFTASAVLVITQE
ncbi:fimbrial protein [Pseudomonas sp. NFXW11]|uniref:fimbrial protein n=1 Tax=Pseudomonas sp. NFXW11 TaxID=2819531 RepID=UPI003CF4EB4E